MATVDIVIFVRHTEGCKYAGDEFARRCDCRKHLRWTAGGKQHRKAAGTRSWGEAEIAKRELADELAGRNVAAETGKAQELDAAIDSFLTRKKVERISADALGKYARELGRLKAFCETRKVWTVQGLTVALLTSYCATWEAR